MRTEFLDKLSEALTLGRLDPNIVITIGDDGTPNIDVSEAIRAEQVRLEAMGNQFPITDSIMLELVRNPEFHKRLQKIEKTLYEAELDEFIGKEHTEEYGLNVSEYGKTIEKFEETKAKIEGLRCEYDSLIKAINFNHIWVDDEPDPELVKLLDKERGEMQEKAGKIMDEIMALKFG